jgi:RNA polymerase sigma factor (sigma-70 family)
MSESQITYLFNTYYNRMVRYGQIYFRLCKYDADEIAQTVFINLMKVSPTLYRKEIEKAYLFTAMQYGCYRLAKYRNVSFRRNTLAIDFACENEIDASLIRPSLTQKMLCEILYDAMRSLPPRRLEVIESFIYEEGKLDATANKNGIAKQTVKNHRANAVANLKKAFREPISVHDIFLLYLN